MFQVTKSKKTKILQACEIYVYGLLQIYDLNIETCCSGLTSASCQMPTNLLSHSPSSTGWERK